MYKDLQENSINGDGSFGIWVYLICGVYLVHMIYTYFIPYYWFRGPMQSGEEEKLRMVSAYASCVLEELGLVRNAEWGWMPHDFAY